MLYKYSQLVLLLLSEDCHASSSLVVVRHSNLFFPAERFSPSGSKLFVALFIIISVTYRPTSSCFVAGFQVISVAGRFAARYLSLLRYSTLYSVADHFSPCKQSFR